MFVFTETTTSVKLEGNRRDTGVRQRSTRMAAQLTAEWQAGRYILTWVEVLTQGAAFNLQ